METVVAKQSIADILQKRLSLKRKDLDINISDYLVSVSQIIGTMRTENVSEEVFLPQVKNVLHFILEDCDIFFEMSREKAMDALNELSVLACLFEIYGDTDYHIVVSNMKRISSSYPPYD